MKTAVLGNYATQFLVKSLKGAFKKEGYSSEIYGAEYNTIEFEILDEHSGLYKFKPDIIVWHESTLGVRDEFYKKDISERSRFAETYTARINSLLGKLAKRLPSVKVLFPNHSLLFIDNVFGNFYSKVEASWQFQVEKANFLLSELSIRHNSFFIVSSMPPMINESITDYTQVANAELHYTPAYLDWLSASLVKIAGSFSGKFKKCVILDLDNTLWGGVIGDDGLEGIQLGSHGVGKSFVRFQKWLKELKNRGVIVAVCSKNEENTAKSPFIEHPEMILKLEDIAVFIANWQSKADNISHIQSILNIGFDSMVFIDDNPAEREIVKKHIPDIVVPELPVDPSEYLPFLINENLFETTSFSENDAERTKQYQEEAKRAELSSAITNMDDFLRSLEMEASVSEFKPIDFDRIAQLTQRSNQFNLRTIRYAVSDIERIAADKNYLSIAASLKDKFGKYGLISVIIIELKGEVAKIDTWIMSCRVLKRTVEQLLMNYIIDELKSKGVKTLYGEYLPTNKNNLVASLLSDLGMKETGENTYKLQVSDFLHLKTFIKHGS